ncbi:hypothetical protein PUNSTDRAFT_101119 [Punctularia strigosozonata HHB-11173 SS5]|uniref:uncharacterized protein n=1 Tax=Punctularia strigosozonata (strain HHB-11173) TaxID=741275 RepID=UPI000441728A|nr:uncharacterized protein PUNSTDRAFT_101119 [Punctularia strigosozonata HHB-11173 SS5]EIN11101.1 hypothetical protein PUNSTDRAFT_101119 [Punctularia strigosozonata HHB-11173 SS5]
MPDQKSSSLYRFHRPHHINLRDAPVTLHLNRSSRQCLRNLVAYRPSSLPFKVPRSRCAAVLVALFAGRNGDLWVILSQRASSLRTYAGDTALPGGKVEPQDKTIVDTARREAFEEIGLPQDNRKVPLLCVMEPFLAGNQLLVTPVVVMVLDSTIKPILNAAEVSSLFSHPLISFLSPDSPFPTDVITLEMNYHTYIDVPWPPHPSASPTFKTGHKRDPPFEGPSKGVAHITPKSRRIRMHRFLTGREAGGTKPIFGLTASILILVASVGYAQEPLFDVSAPGQPTMDDRIAYALRSVY